MTTEKLAKITSAGLSFKDRGLLTLNIHVDYEDGCSQNIAAFCLCDPMKDGDGKHLGRVGTKEGCEVIRRILEVMNVDDLHLLAGQIIWVKGDGEGFSFKPKGFRPLEVNKHQKGEVVWSEIFGTNV